MGVDLIYDFINEMLVTDRICRSLISNDFLSVKVTLIKNLLSSLKSL